MKKNIVWWPAIKNSDHNEKYGGYDYFKYSRKTWEYWCKKNNCLFIPFEIPVEKDLNKFRVNWQKAIFVFDELDRMGVEYDQIALVDSSFMIRWDAPNFFDLTDHKFTAFRDTDNLKWVYDSVQGYKNIFDNFNLDIQKYVNSGFMIFNEQHKNLFQGFKKFYLENITEFCKLQDEVVKKGTEQTPMNYWLQTNDVDINLDLPLPFKLTHLHRKEMFSYNWQLDEDKTPFVIKYGYNYSFNGIPKDERTQIMNQVWNLTKDNYDEKKTMYNNILNEVKHKDTAKYTTSKKFKTDILDNFLNEEYKDKTILELGTSQGMSTRMLSYVFKKVFTVEWDDWNIKQAKKHCKGRDNIEFIKADLYGEEWNLPKPDVVFIDAGHTYDNVKSDIENCLKHFDNLIFIFDDYGLPPGDVKKAIDEKVNSGLLKINKFIGEKPEDLVHAAGTKFFDMEGVICYG
tara:strand:+ start:133 stop:1500 length:1368 start_codon:yes stop_codon:yes gene_type:complete